VDSTVAAGRYQNKILELFSGGPVALFVWSSQQGWPVEYVSDNVREILGYDAAELVRKKQPYADLIHPDDLPLVEAELVGYELV
jgi:PAS domain-containing protein